MISADALDALKEIVNIGVGKAAGTMSTMLNTRINLNVLELEVVQKQKFMVDNGSAVSTVTMDFDGQVSGRSALFFSHDDALKLVSILADESDADEMDELTESVASEVGNIVLNGVLGAISNTVEIRFKYQVPEYWDSSRISVFEKFLDGEAPVLLANTVFEAQGINIKGEIAILFSLGSLIELNSLLDELIDRAA